MSVPPVAVPTPGTLSARVEGQAFTLGDWGVFAAISVIWGASFLFIAIGLESMQPGLVTLVRVGLGALVLNLLPGGRARIERADRRRLLAVSVLWVGVPFTLFPIAEQHINSAVTGLLNGATPMFVALFGALFFGRRTSGPQLLGVAVGFVGIVLISAPSLSEGSNQATGVLLVLLATTCYGVATNLIVPLQLRYGSRVVMAKMLALATIWTLPFGLASLPSSRFEAGPVAAVAVLGVVGTGLAFPLMGTLVGRVGATRASFITYLVPVVALALGVAVQGDEVAVLALVGVVLVVLGAVLASRREATSASPDDPYAAPGGDSDVGGSVG